MIGFVEILSAGLQTSIQDKGRLGYAQFGVPRSGVMDQQSFLLANAILNNDVASAVIEWTMIPPVLKFHGATIICVTGTICVPYLNGKKQKMNHAFNVYDGDVLKFKNVSIGVIGFVGIKNGFLSELVLGSRSYYDTITVNGKLNKKDTISYAICDDFSISNASIKSNLIANFSDIIEVFEGPEYDLLSIEQRNYLLDTQFTISKNRNRMAIPFVEVLENELPSMLTSPVLPGTVQLTPSGQLIVLMMDAQTTGGYPRVLQLSESAMNTIVQKRAGEKVGFVIVSF